MLGREEGGVITGVGVGVTIGSGEEDEPEPPEVTVNVKSLVTMFPAESVMVIVTV
jgi:hypothetical protein